MNLEPCKEKPELGSKYYYPDVFGDNFVESAIFRNDDYDNRILEMGFMWLNEDSAIKSAKALFGVKG